MRVGRRRTSGVPARLTPEGQRPSRWRGSIAEDGNMPQRDPRGQRLAGDSQSLSQHGGRTDLSERVTAVAKQPEERARKGRKQLRPIEDLMKIAPKACASDL